MPSHLEASLGTTDARENTRTRPRRLPPPSASVGRQHNYVVSFALLTSFRTCSPPFLRRFGHRVLRLDTFLPSGGIKVI
ncbi:hypothetical protein MUK42_01461 [Musa troglodytarum]|uniref:Uncharacterized protein n=1 Tax=Musa troglodytarum TaxID=320322 RepID=A0A9E7FBH9_9LILI|nr:hypothetical protein MUK42_01461 [Musa troglodytarum]